MKINHACSLITLLVCISGCAPGPVIPPAPPPVRPSKPQPAPLPPQSPAPRTTDWRDLAQTPGTWRYESLAGVGSAARFGTAGAAPLLVLRCDRARATLTLSRAGAASAPVPASITTSTGTRPLSAIAATDGSPAIEIYFPANDRTLDAMAFSRGRFLVEVNGLPTLNVPAWSEIGRVIEDCR